MDPTKLVLQFSDFSVILYAIYKNQSKLKYYLRTSLQLGPRSFGFLTDIPLLYGKPLGKKGGLAMRPLGGRLARLRPNSGDRWRWGAGRRWGKTQGSPRVDFRARRGREGGRRCGVPVVSGTGRRGWPSRRG
jgi:hypothetical protein